MRNEVRRPRGESGRAVVGGLVGGIVGGVVLSIYLLLLSLASGRDLWMAAKGAGAPFLHERAMRAGFDAWAVLVGLVSHFGVSIVWGVLFGLLAYGLSRGLTLLAGIGWGFVVWLVMYNVVLPALGLGQMARSMPVGPALFEHVLFGLAVGVGFLPFQHPMMRREWQPFKRRARGMR